MTRRQGDKETRENWLTVQLSHASLLQWFALGVILIVAATFRFYGLDWDRGYLFHPDERQIMLVTSNLGLPASWFDFFNPDNPLNPRFFAYGSFPIYLLKLLGNFAPPLGYAVPWRDANLVSLAFLGRVLSGLFDLGSIVFIFLLAKRFYGATVGLMTAACSAVAVLQIQLSHFYTVDTLLTFFVAATIFFAARYADSRRYADAGLMGASFGLAMATKISALPLVVPMLVAVLRANKASGRVGEWASGINENRFPLSLSRALQFRIWSYPLWSTRFILRNIFIVSLAVFFITQPYALFDPIRYFGQIGTESLVARGWLDYPYTRQYADTLPYIYQIWQSSVWGLGLPLGIFAWLGSAFFVWRWLKQRNWKEGFILSWVLVYFLLIGMQYTKYPRYLLPLVPFLFLMASAAFTQNAPRNTKYLLRMAYAVALGGALLYALTFVSIYGREHPWQQISRWIYANAPVGATIAIEHWDDVLPVSIYTSSVDYKSTAYQMQTLPMYDADDDTKKQTLRDTLAASDYIILASPRLYGTITRLPQRYPVSASYYRALFDGRLGYELVAFARNDPSLGAFALADDPVSPIGLTKPSILSKYFQNPQVLNWGHGDESFSVYDHPMPLVFKKIRSLSSDELQNNLSSQ